MSISAPELRAVEVLRQRGDGLQFGQDAGIRLVPEHDDRGAHLVDNVGKAAVRAEHHVARAGTGLDRRKGGLARRQFPFDRVEPVGQHLVQPEVAHERKPIRRIQRDAVRVRPALAIAIDAAAGVLHDVGGRAEPAVWPDWQHRHAAAAVVGDEQIPSLAVEHQMARARAHRRALIQEPQFARRGINRERADRAGRFAFERVELVHREQKPSRQVELEERWVRGLGRQAERDQRDVLRHLESLRLQPEQIDALALGSSVGADVNERLIGHGDARTLPRASAIRRQVPARQTLENTGRGRPVRPSRDRPV